MLRAILFASSIAIAATPALAQTYSSDSVGFDRRTYQILSRMNGLCLDAENGSRRAGASMVLVNCDGAASQRFRVRAGAPNDGVWLIADGGASLCLEAADTQGQPLRLAQCRDGADGQSWRFEARAARPLRSRTGYCANVEGERQSEGARVITWACVGAINEGWIFNPVD